MPLLTENGSIGIKVRRLAPVVGGLNWTVTLADEFFVIILHNVESVLWANECYRITITPSSPRILLGHSSGRLVQYCLEARDCCRNVTAVMEQLDGVACRHRVLEVKHHDLCGE